MKLGYTILYVNDIKSTAEFYQKAFKLEINFMDEKGYVEFKTGETALAFASYDFISNFLPDVFKILSKRKKVCCFEIAFITDDVEESYNHAINAGAISITEPHEQYWGQTVSYVKDINGFLVEISSPVRTPV